MAASCGAVPCMPRRHGRGAVAAAAQTSPERADGGTIHISSTQNPAVKHCVKLRESGKYRRETGSVLLAGGDLVRELAPLCAPYRALVGLEGTQLPDLAAERYVTVTPPVMQKISGVESVGGAALAAEAALPAPANLLAAPRGQLTRVLVLDGVQDPGNLGTLCRTALALGWQAAVLLPGCCDPFNDKALRASRGAMFKLPLAALSVEQWEELVAAQGLIALAAEPDRAGGGGGGGSSGAVSSTAATQQRQQQQQGAPPGGLAEVQQWLGELPVCLCLGAEGQGLSEAVRQRCRPVSIPQRGGGQLMESLNVSAAGAILMFALSPGAGPLLSELAGL